MDHFAEIANSPDLLEALTRVSNPQVAQTGLLDFETHSYGQLRESHPNLWISELINLFYDQPEFAAAVWRELQYARLSRERVAGRAVEILNKNYLGLADLAVSGFLQGAQDQERNKRKAQQSPNFLLRCAWVNAVLREQLGGEDEINILTAHGQRGAIAKLALAMTPKREGEPAEERNSRLEIIAPQLWESFQPRVLMDELRMAADVRWEAPALVRKLAPEDEPSTAAQDRIAALLSNREEISRLAREQKRPLPFAMVHEQEMEQVSKVRELTQRDVSYREAGAAYRRDRPLDHEVEPGPAGLPSKSPIRRAIDQNLVGLAFSGGGIRSATFNLGVLQSLAQLNLLRHCDYLSTVSGGGYIGSWFAAWMQRLGLAAISEGTQDHARRVLQAVWQRLSPLQSPNPLDERVRPIRYLREFSNYLTPRAGLLSADTWTMVAIYLRNAFLNLLILVPSVAALLLAPRFFFQLTEWSYSISFPPLLVPFLMVGLLGTAAAVLVCNTRRISPPVRPASYPQPVPDSSHSEAPPWFAKQKWIQLLVVAPLLLAAWLAATSARLWLAEHQSGAQILAPGHMVELWLTRWKTLSLESAFPHQPGTTAFIAVCVTLPFRWLFDSFTPVRNWAPKFRKWKITISYLLMAGLAWILAYPIPKLHATGVALIVILAIAVTALALCFKMTWGKLRAFLGLIYSEKLIALLLPTLVGALAALVLWIFGRILHDAPAWTPDAIARWAHTGVMWLLMIPPKTGAALLAAVAIFPLLLLVFGASGGFIRCWSSRVEAYSSLAGATFFTSLGAFGLFLAVCEFLAYCDDQAEGFWIALIFGPPLILLALAVTIALQLGLLGSNYPDEQREWWSRLRAWALIYSVGWTVLFAGSLYPPLWYLQIPHFSGGGALIVWILSTAAGIRTAPRAAGAEKQVRESNAVSSAARSAVLSPRVLKAVSSITPYIFIAGLLISVSLVVDAIARSEPHVRSFIWEEYTSYRNGTLGLCALALLLVSIGASWRIGVNEFSMHHFYKNRLVRCYLGASRWKERMADWFTGFDRQDDIRLAEFDHKSRERNPAQHPPYPGPYPIINAALNLVAGEDLAWQERKATSFVFTPKFCGYDVDRALLTKHTEDGDIWPNGYAPTSEYVRPLFDGPLLGMAMAISGAAANPNMGKVTSPASSFLMTVFNVRLGWWLPNPRQPRRWKLAGPGLGMKYTAFELLGLTDDKTGFVNVSDGGHFENLGVYELIRRGCRCIIACDAGQDGSLKMEDLGNLIRKCRMDFGVDIDIDVDRIRTQDGKERSAAHCVVGKIHYSGIPRHDEQGRILFQKGAHPHTYGPPLHEEGWLVYLKPSITGDEPSDVLEYHRRVPEFPHESTADQWFNESQFESYRRLGLHISETAFGRYPGVDYPPEFFEQLQRYWHAPSAKITAHATENALEYSRIMELIRSRGEFSFLDPSLFDELPARGFAPGSRDEFYICNALIQLMENVYFDLDLEQNHGHPEVAGWMGVFVGWVKAPAFRRTWQISRKTYNERFQDFYRDRLKGG